MFDCEADGQETGEQRQEAGGGAEQSNHAVEMTRGTGESPMAKSN
ncbi:MAG: hypothetical protein ABI972_10695 [Acidobacteriota bacterium]